jgi:predicted exporter
MTVARALAWAWLLVVIAASVHVAVLARHGLPLASDLMTLLPREDRDEGLQRAKAAVTSALAQRVVILVGAADPAIARAAAAVFRDRLDQAGLLVPSADLPATDALKRLGAAYFPHRTGLLADADRTRLTDGQAAGLATRALSQLYGFAGTADGRLLARDPYLLFPAFLTALPVPASRLTPDQGWLTVTAGGRSWVLVTGRLTGEATALAFQQRFSAGFAAARTEAAAIDPGVRVLRLGALFYAEAGSRQAMADASFIGVISLVGTIGLMLVIFRAAAPLVLAVVAIGVGVIAAISACLLLFGSLHVAAQLFGASLIGITVDYALLYFGQIFSDRVAPRARLQAVLPGLTLGMATTAVGYATLGLAPFPGLHQVAVFSAVGLVASFLTVVLWFPLLDRTPPAPLDRFRRRLADGLWTVWSAPGWRRGRLAFAVVAVAIGAGGYARLHTDDDLRRQQALDPALLAEQTEIQQLTGFGQTSQFFVVQARDGETALQREEALGERLNRLVAAGALRNWIAPARFVPSAARQAENRALRPPEAALRQRLGLAEPPAEAEAGPLRLTDITATGALPGLAALVLEDGLHVVSLDGLGDPDAVRAATDGLDGVRFVDPSRDLTVLLGAYRQRAVVLLALSAVLMIPLLAWRYGLRRALLVMVPPLAAVGLTPAVLALAGLPFTFFAAMALVLVLSIGSDYAVFCAEDRERHQAVTLAAVAVAMSTTLLSFGLMAASEVAGVRSFGAAMAVGVALAFVLAPIAGRRSPVPVTRAGRTGPGEP